MKYLDYSIMPSFLKEHFSASGDRNRRLVGQPRDYDSGYDHIVRFFGPDKVDPRRIVVTHSDRTLQLADERIRRFARIIESDFRSEGRIFDGPQITHMTSLVLDSEDPSMIVQPADYGDHCGTCLALDYPHPLFESVGGTLRQYYKTRYPSAGSRDHPLARCLGACGFLLTERKGRPAVLRVTRASNLASLENTEGPSAAGTVDWNHDCSNLNEMLHKALGEEITEELALESHEYRIHPLALAIEIFRGERPQLFALITTAVSEPEIHDRLNNLPMDKREFSGFGFTGVDSSLEALNHEGTMNLMLVREWLALCGI